MALIASPNCGFLYLRSGTCIWSAGYSHLAMTLCGRNPCTSHTKESAQYELGERNQTFYNSPSGVRPPSDRRHLASRILLNGTLSNPASGNQDHCMHFEGSICQAGRPFVFQETGSYYLFNHWHPTFLACLFVFVFCCTFCFLCTFNVHHWRYPWSRYKKFILPIPIMTPG